MVHVIKLTVIANSFLLLFVVDPSLESDEIENHPHLNLLPKECGNINEDYILTDKPNFEEFPWMALIIHNKAGEKESFLCSGALINSRYVLTLDECARNGSSMYTKIVRIGEYNVETTIDCEDDGQDKICASPPQDIVVEKVEISPDLLSSSYTNGIALLRLERAVNFEQTNAGAICLPIASQFLDRNLTGVRGTLAGWRLFKNPTTLRKSSFTVISQDNCKEYLRNITNCSQHLPLKALCGRGSLHFEAGTPLMIKGDNQGHTRYTQYGIVSSELQENGIVLFVDISRYMKWILDTIKA